MTFVTIFVLAFFAYFVIIAVRSEKMLVDHAKARWTQSVPGLSGTTSEFYEQIVERLKEHGYPGVVTKVVPFHEGGIHTHKRDYLRVRRDHLIFDICAAPFGSDFFVSEWFSEEPEGVLDMLADQPGIGLVVRVLRRLFSPVTYYRLDSASMFQAAVHNAVVEVVERMTAIQGTTPLSELERRPVMRSLMPA